MADLSGGARGTREPPPPPGQKCLQFHAVFGKIWLNGMLVPPSGVGSPPLGNPRSVTVSTCLIVIRFTYLGMQLQFYTYQLFSTKGLGLKLGSHYCAYGNTYSSQSLRNTRMPTLPIWF